ncbi:MAG: hypothetical protein ACM3OF_12670 [Gemmatimonas sp.]|jgi:hypothetical protein
MRRANVICAAAVLALSAAAMVSPVQASPYQLIRWDNTGVCQVWDEGWSMKPVRWPSDYKVVGKPAPTFAAALAVKNGLLKHGACKF